MNTLNQQQCSLAISINVAADVYRAAGACEPLSKSVATGLIELEYAADQKLIISIAAKGAETGSVWRSEVGLLLESALAGAAHYQLGEVSWVHSGIRANLAQLKAYLGQLTQNEELPIVFLVALKALQTPAHTGFYATVTRGMAVFTGYEIEVAATTSQHIRHSGKLALRLARDILKRGEILTPAIMPGILNDETVKITCRSIGVFSDGPVLLIESSHF
jgi:hypothetical protein